MLEKHEIVAQMFNGFDYERYFTSDTREKLIIILEAQEYILSLEDGKNRFIKMSISCQVICSISSTPEAMDIKEEVGFFKRSGQDL
jgi:type I restriction enzyme R subunit